VLTKGARKVYRGRRVGQGCTRGSSSFLILYTVDRAPWMRDQPVVRPLHIHRRAQAQNKDTQAFMPPAGFEPTISALGLAKAVHAWDCTATVICTETSITRLYSYFPHVWGLFSTIVRVIRVISSIRQSLSCKLINNSALSNSTVDATIILTTQFSQLPLGGSCITTLI
jgi:hypothetical protein